MLISTFFCKWEVFGPGSVWTQELKFLEGKEEKRLPQLPTGLFCFMILSERACKCKCLGTEGCIFPDDCRFVA